MRLLTTCHDSLNDVLRSWPCLMPRPCQGRKAMLVPNIENGQTIHVIIFFAVQDFPAIQTAFFLAFSFFFFLLNLRVHVKVILLTRGHDVLRYYPFPLQRLRLHNREVIISGLASFSLSGQTQKELNENSIKRIFILFLFFWRISSTTCKTRSICNSFEPSD